MNTFTMHTRDGRTMWTRRDRQIVLEQPTPFLAWSPWEGPHTPTGDMPAHLATLPAGTVCWLDGIAIGGERLIVRARIENPWPERNGWHVMGGWFDASLLIHGGFLIMVNGLAHQMDKAFAYRDQVWALLHQEFETWQREQEPELSTRYPMPGGEDRYVGYKGGYALVGRARVSD